MKIIHVGVDIAKSVFYCHGVARNVRVTLKGKTMSDAERQGLIKDGTISAGTAGLLRLLLG